MYTPIHQWAEDDRPREKFLLKGKSTLSDSELLAILIGSGSRNESAVQLCQRILASVDHDLNNLGKLTVKRLTDFKGIGEAKAITIAAALELGRRRKFDLDFDPIYVNSSKAVFTMMHPLIGDLLHEEFWVISVNNSLKFLQKTLISKGGITGTVVDVRLVFKAALECNATGVFLVHNHPSGKLEPSEPDKKITTELMKAGKILHLPIYDHVIISDLGYYSFRDDGIF